MTIENMGQNPYENPFITDSQKVDLFNEAMYLFEDKINSLSVNVPIIKKELRIALRSNIGSLIEEICNNNPENGVVLCREFFKELLDIFEGKDLSSLSEEDKGNLHCLFIHTIKMKLSPLLIKKMEELGDDRSSELYRRFFTEDQEDFSRNGFSSYIAIVNSAIPPWYRNLEERINYQQMLAKSTYDPEVAKRSKEIHEKAMRNLKGEE